MRYGSAHVLANTHLASCTHLKETTSLYEEGRFVCFVLYLWDPLNQDASDCILGLFGKLLTRKGALAWFQNIWTCSAKFLEYWMNFSLKIKLNRSWKFWRSWNVLLVLFGRSWWADFNGIYLVRFGFRMWEICILKWFLLMKIQISSKKPGFGRKISWGRGNTWANGIGHTSCSYVLG
jgi:hypothetical protein